MRDRPDTTAAAEGWRRVVKLVLPLRYDGVPAGIKLLERARDALGVEPLVVHLLPQAAQSLFAGPE